MATIDQRILIPVSQEGVWAYLSEIGNNPSWQTDCQGISFLSSKRQGVGTRWRATDDKGHDAIYEVLSWYNGLGYEYTCIDGCNYRESRVRIRLQEIAEGTIVQWTYSFEPKGLLSGRSSRQLENVMAASLKSLYRQVKTANKSGQLTPRSLMQDSPDVGGRSSYQPRHAAQFDEKKHIPGTPMPVISEPPIVADDGQEFEAFVFDEPPIVESDTRPHPVITETGESAALKAEKESSAASVTLDEPDFLADVPARSEAAALDFELNVPVAGTAETFVDDAIFAPPEEVQPEEPAKPLPSQVMTEALDAVVVEAAPEIAPEPAAAPQAEPEPRLEVIKADPLETQDLPPLEPALPTATPTHEGETRSIWEIFGLPKPSEVGGTPAPLTHAETSVTAATEATSEPKQDAQLVFRHGFRARERRKIARIRYPQ